MQIRYKIKLENWEYNQPILMLHSKGDTIHLIPSRCHEASLPEGFTKDPFKMKSLREQMITSPKERFDRIGHLIESFTKADLLAEWELKVNDTFSTVKSKQLFHPKCIDQRTKYTRDWSDYEKRNIHHTEPLNLQY